MLREFSSSWSKPIKRATVYASALGNYELYLNGRQVGDAYFTPGWTDYNTRVYYNTFDVTDHVNKGFNALGGILADGWYSGHIGWGHIRDHYGKNPASRPSFRSSTPTAAQRRLPPTKPGRPRRVSGGDMYFTPGWTDYAKRVYYNTYDVTDRINKGANTLGGILADGWYSGYIGWMHIRDHYGNNPRFAAQLHLEYADGTSQTDRHRRDLESRDRPHPRRRLPDGRDLRRPQGDPRLEHARLRRRRVASRRRRRDRRQPRSSRIPASSCASSRRSSR